MKCRRMCGFSLDFYDLRQISAKSWKDFPSNVKNRFWIWVIPAEIFTSEMWKIGRISSWNLISQNWLIFCQTALQASKKVVVSLFDLSRWRKKAKPAKTTRRQKNDRWVKSLPCYQKIQTLNDFESKTKHDSFDWPNNWQKLLETPRPKPSCHPLTQTTSHHRVTHSPELHLQPFEG